MTEHHTMCVICTKERTATVGYLCDAHFDRLADMLRQIEDEATHLDPVPSMAQRTGSGGGSLASERAPARLDVLVHTDHRRGTGKSETDDDALAAGHTLPILDVLGSWARIVREERGLVERATEVRMPDGGPSAWAPSPVTITGERDLLTRHLDWIARQDWVDEMFTDVRQLVGQLKAVNGTAPDKPVGRCYLPDSDGECGGPIWVDSAHGHAHCGRCKQTWDGPQLAMLSFELERARVEAVRPRTEDGRRMLTAQELVDDGIVSTVSNVRVTAHRRGITSVNGHYDPEGFRDKACA